METEIGMHRARRHSKYSNQDNMYKIILHIHGEMENIYRYAQNNKACQVFQ